MINNLSYLIKQLESQTSKNPQNNINRIKEAIAYFNLNFLILKKSMLGARTVKDRFVNI